MPEDDHASMLRREVCEGNEHVVRELGIAIPRGDVLEPRLAAELPASCPVDRAIDDDAMQPCAERPSAVETVEMAQRSEEGLLGDVLGGRCVVDDQERGPERLRPVQAEEGLECRS